MLNEDSSLEDVKSYLFAGTGATLGGVLTPEEVLNFIVAFDEEQQVDSTEKELLPLLPLLPFVLL